jgi:hypothetical protein
MSNYEASDVDWSGAAVSKRCKKQFTQNSSTNVGSLIAGDLEQVSMKHLSQKKKFGSEDIRFHSHSSSPFATYQMSPEVATSHESSSGGSSTWRSTYRSTPTTGRVAGAEFPNERRGSKKHLSAPYEEKDRMTPSEILSLSRTTEGRGMGTNIYVHEEGDNDNFTAEQQYYQSNEDMLQWADDNVSNDHVPPSTTSSAPAHSAYYNPPGRTIYSTSRNGPNSLLAGISEKLSRELTIPGSSSSRDQGISASSRDDYSEDRPKSIVGYQGYKPKDNTTSYRGTPDSLTRSSGVNKELILENNKHGGRSLGYTGRGQQRTSLW